MMENRDEVWMHDLQDFISYWEKEVNALSEKKLDSEECCEIADLFQRDRNLLICRIPSRFSEEDIVSQLQPLASKLDVSLAMALCSVQVKNF